ncbi:MAG: radical SAM family heme chaperone HemW [Bacteroidales bacterium]|nr:radical SAM family heme chaperone HemW [Bacteroidales bacterium]
MAGYYVHIPFCRQACRYCDYYFTVSLKYKEELVDSIVKEIKNKKKYFEKQEFKTLYFGGGTPSVLNEKDIKRIITEIRTHYNFVSQPEITFEANPDDLNPTYLKMLRSEGINRLSIGIQSFHDKDLNLMRRSHNAIQAIDSIKNAQDAEISNLNIDLIYGIPGMSFMDWQENLEISFKQNVTHISAYHLSFEPGTVFDHWRKKKKIIPIEEEESLEQFKYLIKKTAKEMFLHYEISNFAKEGYLSEHNKNYWNGIPFLGIGPSAHSYDGRARSWNISSIKQYIDKTQNGSFNYTENETLSTTDRYNEYILTSLRTMWGIDLNEISQEFGINYVKYTEEIAADLFRKNLLEKKEQKIFITPNGIF